jgi:NAD-dependent deacetylase
MLLIGTSQIVEPAATLPVLARRAGAKIIGIGPEPGVADVWLNGKAGILLPRLVQRFLDMEQRGYGIP